MKILVVDDDSLINSVFSTKLKEEGYTVFQAYNGEEGLKRAQEVNPDMVLLDIMMPKMNGLTMLKLLREKEQGDKTPVMIVSTAATSENISEAMGDKVHRFIIKDASQVDDLVKTVNSILKKENT